MAVIRGQTSWDRKRLARRNEKWPDAPVVVYNPAREAGFCTVPRTLSLVATLIKDLSNRDPSRAYVDLWLRQRNDGYVETEDLEEMAASAGLTGTRAVKSWKEKIEELRDLGFIRIKEKGQLRYKFILLLNPHRVVHDIREATPERIHPVWWSYYENRISDIGANIRGADPEPPENEIDLEGDGANANPPVLAS